MLKDINPVPTFKRKAIAAKTVVMAALIAASVSAHAEIPAAVGTAFAAIETDAEALFAMVVPYVVAVLGLMIVLRLIKKFGNKIA